MFEHGLFSSFGGTALAGGLVAAVVAGWGYVKGFFAQLRGLFICDVHVSSNTLLEMGLCYWLRSNARLVPPLTRHYQQVWLTDRPRPYPVLAENYSQSFLLFFYGWRPLWLSRSSPEPSHGLKAVAVSSASASSPDKPPASVDDRGLTLSFFRWTFSPDVLARQLMTTAETHFGGGGQHCHRLNSLAANVRVLGEGGFGYYRQVMDVVREQVIAPEEVYDLFHEVRTWKEHAEWYRARGIPWRRGWVLHGPPGSGKTSLLRHISAYVDMGIALIDLSTFTNNGLRKKWRDLTERSPLFVVIEDIDAVFRGRENLLASSMEQSGLGASIARSLQASKSDDGWQSSPQMDAGPPYVTFDALLNIIDGADTGEGIFLVITTNNLDTLDPALANAAGSTTGYDKPMVSSVGSRPGRIDRIIHLGYMALAEKRRMVDTFLRDMPEQRRRLHSYLDAHPDAQETPAQMRERCVAAALSSLWRDSPTARGLPELPREAAETPEEGVCVCP